MVEDFKSSALATVTSYLQSLCQEPIKILNTWQIIQTDIQKSQKNKTVSSMLRNVRRL